MNDDPLMGMPIERFQLANGLDVVLQPDPGVPLVAINLWYRVGSRDEEPGRTGLAHLFEHLLFEGSANVGRHDHFALVQKHGGVANGSTWFDRTNYHETLPTHAMELGLWLEADRMGFLEATLDQSNLDNQRDVVKNERRFRNDNQPYGTWYERLLAMAYPGDFPYAWPVIGSMADLDAATLDDVRAFYRRHYSAANAVLTLAGDFDPKAARTAVERYFGDLPKIEPPPRRAVEPPGLTETRRARVEDDVRLPKLFRMYAAPALRNDDFEAADLLTTILGSGRASRLHRRLVVERELARDAAAMLLPLELVGQIHVQATCREGVAPETLEQAIDEELTRLIEDGIAETELERARNRAEADLLGRLATVTERADLLSGDTVVWGDPGRVRTEPARYRAITGADVGRVAASALGAPPVSLWMVPKAS